MKKMILIANVLFACGAHDPAPGGARAELSDSGASQPDATDSRMQASSDAIETQQMSEDDAEEPVAELTKVVLRYRDASVPPEFHRSYVIVVDPQRVAVTVDVYGDAIAQASYDMTQPSWAALQERSQSVNWPGQDVETLEQVGGALFTLELHSTNATRQIEWTNGAASSEADVTELVQTIQQLAPDLETLKATKYDG